MSPIQKPRLHRFDQYNRPNRPWMKRVFLQKDLRSLTLAVPNRILDQSDAAGVSNSKSTTDRRVRTKWAPHVPFLQFGESCSGQNVCCHEKTLPQISTPVQRGFTGLGKVPGGPNSFPPKKVEQHDTRRPASTSGRTPTNSNQALKSSFRRVTNPSSND